MSPEPVPEPHDRQEDGNAQAPPPTDPLPRVPDDASSLARDVEALRRERRAHERRSRLLRWALGRSGAGVGAPLVAAVLVSVSLVAALPVVLRPDVSDEPVAAPLARPAVAPGQVGGLLPDVALLTPAGRTSAARSARPGVLVLVPTRCGCDAAVNEAVVQSREFTRNVRLITDGRVPEASREADRLRTEVARGLTRSAVDPTGALSSAYAARGVTVLAVAADGVVRDVLTDVQPGQRLEARLGVLRRPPSRTWRG